MHTSFFTKLTNPFQHFINVETYLRNIFFKKNFYFTWFYIYKVMKIDQEFQVPSTQVFPVFDILYYIFVITKKLTFIYYY